MLLKVKILIIRFSSIGDIVLTTPVIRCLKQQLEGNVEIHFLTKKIYQDLLNHNPYLTKVHCIEKSTNEVINELKREQFDYIIDLHRNLRSSQVKKKLKSLSFSFKKLNLQKWLLVNFKINRLPNIHIVDRYLNAVKPLGVENDGKGLDYFIDPDCKRKFKLPNSIPEHFTVLVTGANHATKKLTLEKAIDICSKLSEYIVLIGGKEDFSFGEELQKTNPQKIYNACGKTSLNESAYIIEKAKLVITPDTGMMHIAAAFQKKIISVWGNTVPDFGMYPYLEKGNESNSHIIEVNNLNCRPCSKIGFNKCPKGHFKCIQEIDVNELVSISTHNQD